MHVTFNRQPQSQINGYLVVGRKNVDWHQKLMIQNALSMLKPNALKGRVQASMA